jgi:two-component system KDP operon response regulator KdpE
MLMVVGRSTGASERIRLLDAGADDNLGKPFDEDELLARVRALLRRHPLSVAGRGGELVSVTEALSLDLAGQRLVPAADGQRSVRELRLSDTEFRLLAHFVRHEGRVLTRDALLETIWGYAYDGSTREVDVYVRYLRRKLEPNPARPRYLLTAWGRGYQFRRLPASQLPTASAAGATPRPQPATLPSSELRRG